MGLARGLAAARGGRRLGVLLAAYLVLTLLVGWRLVSVQVLAADDFAQLAARQTQREVELPASRGRLYDRDGEALALSLAADTIYADPRVLRDEGVAPAAAAAELAPLLDRPAAQLGELLARDAGFVYLARQLPRGVGDRVEALGLPGVGVLSEPTRSYPAGSLAAQVVGFAGVDNEGLTGLEAQYDDLLAGRAGVLRVEQAPGGVAISAAPREVQPATAGVDLVLTLDRQIQHVAERALAAAVDEHGARGGSAVVLDVSSGEVLAMASMPGFEPDEIGEVGAYRRNNRAVTDVYEPGSVSKVVTAAAAIEEGVVWPDERFTVPDHYQAGTQRIRDSSAHDPWDVTFSEIVARSSNVGTIRVAERLGPEALYEYLRAFGYAQTTGLGFPGEAAGLLAPVDQWWATSLPTIAIGQGVSVTLLQVAGVLHTIANDGERVTPSLVRGTVGADGRLRSAGAPDRTRVVSAHTADAVARILEGAVHDEHATGRQAAVPGYRVAGKTGTAQKPSTTSRGYEEGKYVASFAGFAPADAPEVVVAVMIDEPSGDATVGGAVAAPVFREIAGFALTHRRVPATGPDGGGAVAPAAATSPSAGGDTGAEPAA